MCNARTDFFNVDSVVAFAHYVPGFSQAQKGDFKYLKIGVFDPWLCLFVCLVWKIKEKNNNNNDDDDDKNKNNNNDSNNNNNNNNNPEMDN